MVPSLLHLFVKRPVNGSMKTPTVAPAFGVRTLADLKLAPLSAVQELLVRDDLDRHLPTKPVEQVAGADAR